ncbi:CAMK family protein kinase [Tritrichomonas foetus]|uniref:non-specific serine/threonine protein kinase n=1 Tax=Tritrichomonas foetus TaxID=1144522 RepID=A0A1J4K455_9EUKA|nr:CAMK family protein kinase [Tritrichomonas foetus]|eukprot:OHT04277.1 CAMK family protein kinase [Tritrichomonas foetus]
MGNQVVIPSMGNWYYDTLYRMNITIRSQLESGTFFLTFDCVNKYGEELIVKAYEYNAPLDQLNLIHNTCLYLTNLNESLDSTQGIVNYLHFSIFGNRAFLIRPKYQFTLRQRMDEYPPLKKIEKLWISYNIIESIKSLHELEMTHGSIHPDNIFTSWNMQLFLGDISSTFKPSHIRFDRVDLFHHYFSSCYIYGCYLAPEQIMDSDSQNEILFGHYSYSMDLFSIGCVIYYLYTNSNLFSFSTLYLYKRGELDITEKLLSLPENIREFTTKLLSLNNETRMEALNNLKIYFPNNFAQISSQFSAFFTSDSGISHFVALIPVFEEICENSDPKIRLLFSNIFSYFLIKSNEIQAMCKFVHFFADFVAPLSSNVKISRILPYFCALFTSPSSSLKRAAISAIIVLFQSINSIPKGYESIIVEYLLPTIHRTSNAANKTYRCALAEIFPVLFSEILRVSSTDVSDNTLTFLVTERDEDVLLSFASCLKNMKKDYKLFDFLFPVIALTLNLNFQRYKIRIIEILMSYYDESSLKDRHTLVKLILIVVQMLIMDLQFEIKVEMIVTYSNFFLWAKNKGILRKSHYPDLYFCLSSLEKNEDPCITFLRKKLTLTLPDPFQFMSMPKEILKIRKEQPIESPISDYYQKNSLDENNFHSSNSLSLKVGLSISPEFLQSIKICQSPINKITSSFNQNICAVLSDRNNQIFFICPPSDKDSFYTFNAFGKAPGNKIYDIHEMKYSENVLFSTNEGKIYTINLNSNKVIGDLVTLDSNVVNIISSSSNEFYAVTENSQLFCFDIRSGQITNNMKYHNLTSTSVCTWKDNVLLGVGFKEGFVELIDNRIFLPLTSIPTNSVDSIFPVARNKCSFSISTPNSVECYDAETNKLEYAFICPSPIISQYDGSVIVLSETDSFYINSSDIVNSLTLYDQTRVSKMICNSQNDIDDSNSESIYLKSKYTTTNSSLHSHSYPILSVCHKSELFISGDTAGFVNIWRI